MPITLDGTLGITTPAINVTGSSTFTSGSFTNLAYTGTLTGGTGVVNLGSGQFYKDASGNVGIGTSSPSFKLDVANSTNTVVKIKTTSAGSYGALQIFNSTTNSEASIGFRDDSDSDATSWVIGKSVGVADAFGFYNGSTRMLIDSSGNVGIGVTSPKAWLSTGGGASTGTSNSYRLYDDGASKTDSANNSYGLGFLNASGVFSYTAGTSGSHAFYTANAERMRIDSSGNLCLGTTSTYLGTYLFSLQKSLLSTTNGGGGIVNINNNGATSTTKTYNSVLRLTSSGSGADCNIVMTDSSAYNYYFGGAGGTLYCMGGNSGGVGLTQGATSWASLSDATMKNVTGTYTTPLADIAQLEAVKFTWKDDSDNKPQVGVIAQSVLSVVPEAVDIDDKGILSVRYTELIPLMIAAIQEQQALIESLTTRLTVLEGAK